MARLFTREEAEAALARIRPLMEEIQRRKLLYDDLRRDVDATQAKVKGNGHIAETAGVAEKREQLQQVERSLAEMVDKVQELGAEVKDLDLGLLDFRGLREGREVYLCWKVGEPRIEWWHTLEGGYRARQRLE